MTATIRMGTEIISANWWLRGTTKIAAIIRTKKQKRERKSVQMHLMAATRRDELPQHLPITVTMVRVMGPRQRLFDAEENLTVGWKHIKDAIAAYYGLNDNDPRITWQYHQERGEKPSSMLIVEGRIDDGN